VSSVQSRASAKNAPFTPRSHDAIHLAQTAAGKVGRSLVDLLARSTTAALELGLDLDLELHCGDEPR